MKLWMALSLLALSAPAHAQTLVDPAALDRDVAAFVGAEPGMPGGAAQPIDRRLRLAACPAAPALDWYGARRDTVRIQCPVQGGWRLFVPLVAGAYAAAAADPVIARGDAVTITVGGSDFAVSQPGEALEQGAVGAWIKVRGIAANAPTLRARVLRPGLVALELP